MECRMCVKTYVCKQLLTRLRREKEVDSRRRRRRKNRCSVNRGIKMNCMTALSYDRHNGNMPEKLERKLP